MFRCFVLMRFHRTVTRSQSHFSLIDDAQSMNRTSSSASRQTERLIFTVPSAVPAVVPFKPWKCVLNIRRGYHGRATRIQKLLEHQSRDLRTENEPWKNLTSRIVHVIRNVLRFKFVRMLQYFWLVKTFITRWRRVLVHFNTSDCLNVEQEQNELTNIIFIARLRGGGVKTKFRDSCESCDRIHRVGKTFCLTNLSQLSPTVTTMVVMFLKILKSCTFFWCVGTGFFSS